MLYQFVQIVDSVAVVDSRDYCEKVIEVHHGDWFNNVLKKHQTSIETRFGTLRFQNGAVLSANGIANNTERFALLTESQCNACLVLSRNLAKTIERKLELVAEFETYKENAKKQLERQLSLTALDTPGYPHTADELWQDSGIVNRRQVHDAIKRDFTEGKHWYSENGQVHISEICYKILLLNLRSRRGSNISKLGERLNIPIAELYEYEQRKRSNTRNPQKYSDPMQLSLFN